MRSDFRFLLFAVVAFASVAGLIRYSNQQGKALGYRQGFDAAINQRLSEHDLVAIEYSVAEVIQKAYPDENRYSAIESLRELIIEKVKPETWGLVGGYGTIFVNVNAPGSESLVVDNSIPVQLEVTRLLDDLRGAALGIRDRNFVKRLYEAKIESSDVE